jgi:hypothetical protein
VPELCVKLLSVRWADISVLDMTELESDFITSRVKTLDGTLILIRNRD